MPKKFVMINEAFERMTVATFLERHVKPDMERVDLETLTIGELLNYCMQPTEDDVHPKRQWFVRDGVVRAFNLELQTRANVYGIPAVSLTGFSPEAEIRALVGELVLEKHLVIPLFRTDRCSPGGHRELALAMAKPTDTKAIDDITFLTGNVVFPVLASEADIRAAIKRIYAPS